MARKGTLRRTAPAPAHHCAMLRSTSSNISKYFTPLPRPSSPPPSSPSASLPLSSRRKRKHVDVEFEPEKKNKGAETKEINSLEKDIKKELTSTKNNKVLI